MQARQAAALATLNEAGARADVEAVRATCREYHVEAEFGTLCKAGTARQMDIAHIHRRLAAYQPVVIDAAQAARAAVAVVLGQTPAGVELLLIQRATRAGDPWSGHVAFPGGHRHPEDADAIATAARETHEEVGVDLGRDAEVIGRLDELRAVAYRRPLDLLIAPIVFALRRPVVLRPNPHEVDGAVWVPLTVFFAAGARATYTRSLDGDALDYPSFRVGTYTVWGLTHRILDGFLDIVRTEAAALV